MAENDFCTVGFDDEEWIEAPSPRLPWIADERAQLIRMLESLWLMPSDPTIYTLEEANQPALAARFRELSDRWQHETAHMSSPLQRMMHQSYQTILGLTAMNDADKTEIIRLMLRDLKENRRDWIVALGYLTGADPIDPLDAGKTDKNIQSWLSWGRAHGLIDG